MIIRENVLIRRQALVDKLLEIFDRLQVSREDGKYIADTLIQAEQWGVNGAALPDQGYGEPAALHRPGAGSCSPSDLQDPGKVFVVCHEAEIFCGSFVDGPGLIARYRDLGTNVYWTGTDIGLLCTGFKAVCDSFQAETQ